MPRVVCPPPVSMEKAAPLPRRVSLWLPVALRATAWYSMVRVSSVLLSVLLLVRVPRLKVTVCPSGPTVGLAQAAENPPDKSVVTSGEEGVMLRHCTKASPASKVSVTWALGTCPSGMVRVTV